jgi:hypothetical protein
MEHKEENVQKGIHFPFYINILCACAICLINPIQLNTIYDEHINFYVMAGVNPFCFFYVYINEGWERRYEIMKFKIKIAILLAAILVSALGFNLITCSTCVLDVFKSGKAAHYQVTTKVVSVVPNIPAAP